MAEVAVDYLDDLGLAGWDRGGVSNFGLTGRTMPARPS